MSCLFSCFVVVFLFFNWVLVSGFVCFLGSLFLFRPSGERRGADGPSGRRVLFIFLIFDFGAAGGKRSADGPWV